MSSQYKRACETSDIVSVFSCDKETKTGAVADVVSDYEWISEQMSD